MSFTNLKLGLLRNYKDITTIEQDRIIYLSFLNIFVVFILITTFIIQLFDGHVNYDQVPPIALCLVKVLMTFLGFYNVAVHLFIFCISGFLLFFFQAKITAQYFPPVAAYFSLVVIVSILFTSGKIAFINAIAFTVAKIYVYNLSKHMGATYRISVLTDNLTSLWLTFILSMIFIHSIQKALNSSEKEAAKNLKQYEDIKQLVQNLEHSGDSLSNASENVLHGIKPLRFKK